jgi:hypothetical protein
VLHALRLSGKRVKTQLAFLHYPAVVRGSNATIGAGQHACVTAYAFVFIKPDNAVLNRQRAGYAAFNAIWVYTVTARHGEVNLRTFGITLHGIFNVNTWVNTFIFQGASHIFGAGLRERAIIFTQVTAKAPFFVYIYSPHYVTLPRVLCPVRPTRFY